MQRFFEIVKRHPWLIGGSVVGLIVFYYIWTSSSSTTPASSGTQSGDTGQLQAQVQLGLNQQNNNAAVAMANSSNNAAVTIAQGQTSTSNAAIAANENVLNQATAAQVTLGSQAVQLGSQYYNTQLNLANVQSAMTQALATTAFNGQVSNNQTAVTLATVNGTNAVNLAAQTGTNAVNQINAAGTQATAYANSPAAILAGFNQAIVNNGGNYITDGYNASSTTPTILAQLQSYLPRPASASQ